MKEARDRLLAQLAAEERKRQGSDHPAAEWLTAYHAGELAAEEAAELQAHLAVCPLCTRALLDLPRFYDEAGEPAQDELEEAWPAVSLVANGPLRVERRKNDQGPPPGTAERRIRFPPVLVYVLAASLAGCLIGFPLGVATHPQKSRPLVVATARSVVTRGSGNGEPLTLSLPGPAGGSPTLVWQLPDRSDPPATYRVELQNPAGRTLLSAETTLTVLAVPPGDRFASSGTPRSLAVELPLERLTPGDYRLLLSSLPEAEPLDQRPLHIQAASPGL